MHWKWKLCLVPLKWRYHNTYINRDIIFDDACEHILWILHAFFGIPRGEIMIQMYLVGVLWLEIC